jgi:hypothetical protein
VAQVPLLLVAPKFILANISEGPKENRAAG